MIERDLEIINRLGLHARAAARLVHTASAYSSAVTIERDGERVDGKSILGLLLLAAPQGTTVHIECEGADEAAAAEALERLFADRFGESA